MNFFNYIVNIVRARKAKSVVKAFTSYVRAHSAESMTNALDFYQASALHIVKKTEEDEKPLTDLLLALDVVLKHYGPGLAQELATLKQRMDEVEDNDLVAARRVALDVALGEIKHD